MQKKHFICIIKDDIIILHGINGGKVREGYHEHNQGIFHTFALAVRIHSSSYIISHGVIDTIITSFPILLITDFALENFVCNSI